MAVLETCNPTLIPFSLTCVYKLLVVMTTGVKAMRDNWTQGNLGQYCVKVA